MTPPDISPSVLADLSAAVLKSLHEPGSRAWPELGLQLSRADFPEVAHSELHEPSLVFMLQGSKHLVCGMNQWHCEAGQVVLVGLPMLLTCDTPVFPSAPVLGVSVALDMGSLADLWSGLPTQVRPSDTPHTVAHGLTVAPMDADLAATLLRLLTLLDDPLAPALLGDGLRKELLYRALRGGLGEALARLLGGRARVATVMRAVQRLRSHVGKPPSIARLAREMALSPSAFYAIFSEVMGTSPLQYLKQVRLHRARQLLQQGGVRVADVAQAVGYASTSQFSREFKRLFGEPPGQVIKAA